MGEPQRGLLQLAARGSFSESNRRQLSQNHLCIERPRKAWHPGPMFATPPPKKNQPTTMQFCHSAVCTLVFYRLLDPTFSGSAPKILHLWCTFRKHTSLTKKKKKNPLTGSPDENLKRKPNTAIIFKYL